MRLFRKITSGWSVRRVFYLIAGGLIFMTSISDQQWLGAMLGGYFAAMGIFAFGCASGQCNGSACSPESDQPPVSD